MRILRICLLFMVLQACCTYMQSQNDSYVGDYSFQTELPVRRVIETIRLESDGTFSYEHSRMVGAPCTLNGKWEVIDDTTLVLNTFYQRKKTMVYELPRIGRRSQKRRFRFIDTSNGLWLYCYGINFVSDKDTLTVTEPGDIMLKKKYFGFFIEQFDGYCSDFYRIKNSNALEVEVLYDPNRSCNDEHWIISNGTIRSRQPNGELSPCVMKKETK